MYSVPLDTGDPLSLGVTLALLALISAAVWWRNRPVPRLLTDGIRDGVARLGLAADGFGAASAEGEVDGVLLHLSVRWVDRGRELTLRVLEPLSSDLLLAPEAAGGGPDLRIGDPVFDRTVRVTTGDPARALAILDPATRDAVSAAVSNGARLAGDGWVRTWLASEVAPDGAELARTGRAVARAHRAMVRALASKPIEGTVDRLRSDRSRGVRRHALGVLGERGLATSRVLTPSLEDLDPEVRLSVATRLGAWDVVADLVRTGSRTWRVRAAAALAADPRRISEPDRVLLQDVLVGALSDPELAATAAEVLGRIGDPRVLPALVDAATHGPSRDAARAAADGVRERHAEAAGGLTLASGDTGGGLSVPLPDGRLSVVRESG